MSVSLLDLLMNLLNDPATKAAFEADPQGFLADCGLDNLSPEDVHDAIALAADNESHDYKGGHGGHGGHDGGHMPPPPPVQHHQGDSPHEAAVRYLNNYVTNNYVTVDARETNIDNSINQHIDTHGGDVDQHIDNHPVTATGDGAVAVGGNNSAPIATGDHAVAGNGNVAVDGDDNALAFGDGNASNLHNATATDGGAISGDGPAIGGDHTELTNFGSGSVGGHDASQTGSNNDTDSHADSHADSSTNVDSHATTTTTVDADSHDHLASDNDLTLASNNTDDHTDSHDIDHNHVDHAII